MASLIIPSYIGILPLSLILILICISFFKNSSIYPLQSLLNPQRDGPVYPERLTNHPCRFSGELSSLTAVHNILSYHFLICPLFFSSLRHLLIKNKWKFLYNSNRQAKIPTLANLSLDEDESALRVRSKIAPSCSSSAFSSLSSTPANSGRKGTISQRTFLKAESTDDFSVSSDGPLIRGSVGGGGGAVGAVVVCASGDELEVTTESSQILTPAARTNIANRSKEALQRHQVSSRQSHRHIYIKHLLILSLQASKKNNCSLLRSFPNFHIWYILKKSSFSFSSLFSNHFTSKSIFTLWASIDRACFLT